MMFKRQELYIRLEDQKMDQKLKCPLTQLINMPFQSRDNKAQTTIMSVILKELQKRYGNIAIECYMKENTKQSMPNKGKTLMQ
jgi:hypothetical protein